jgi:hypothetical protein
MWRTASPRTPQPLDPDDERWSQPFGGQSFSHRSSAWASRVTSRSSLSIVASPAFLACAAADASMALFRSSAAFRHASHAGVRCVGVRKGGQSTCTDTVIVVRAPVDLSSTWYVIVAPPVTPSASIAIAPSVPNPTLPGGPEPQSGYCLRSIPEPDLHRLIRAEMCGPFRDIADVSYSLFMSAGS